MHLKTLFFFFKICVAWNVANSTQWNCWLLKMHVWYSQFVLINSVFPTENTYLFFWEPLNHKQEWMGNVKVESIFHVCFCLDFTFLGFYLAVGMKIKTSSVASQDGCKKEFSFQNQKWDVRELGLSGVGGECPVPVLPSQPVTLTRLYLSSLQFILILKWGSLHLNHL